MRSIDYAAQKLGGESALEELAAAVDLPKQEFIRLMQRQAKPVSLQSPVWEDGPHWRISSRTNGRHPRSKRRWIKFRFKRFAKR